ncbi:MAG: teichoic acid transporter ATP-binding protein [Paenibacillaceae bacterium]|nr:teichoic acid transporter ATP-binding protein [Paenibacillaceae bacterium]
MSNEQENIIEVHNVSMRFNLAKQKVDNLKEYIVRIIKRQLLFDEFYALRNVSLSIKRGESFAIIGENGCGKSTLLKVISGIFSPTEGNVLIRGSIAPLIELGAGFDMDLTARENIYLNGAVLGYDKEFMDEHFQEIMDFAELWDFVDVPIKNYSSGMVARLGFAIATVVVPDILIVDEILSVGDFMFQQKCERKMQEMINQGATLIFVSHSIEQVKTLCQRAVWLKYGIVQMVGSSEEVCNQYVADMEIGGNGLVRIEEAIEEPQVDTLISPNKDAPKIQLKFLNLLRALAICMILWNHLGPFRFPGWGGTQIVSNIFNRPLGVIQHFGVLGIVLFFLINGFLTPYTALRENKRSFAKKRFFKIIPPLLLAIGVFYFVQKVVSFFTGEPTYWDKFTVHQWITSATLFNYFIGEPDVINGITWYLFPLIIFYILCCIFYNYLQTKPKLVIIIFEIIIGLIALLPAKAEIPHIVYNVFQSSWYIVFLVFGMLIYYIWNSKINLPWFLFLSGINYYLYIKCLVYYAPSFYEETPYSISFIYAYALFVIAMLLEEKIKQNRLIIFLSKISYSIYITHMIYGGLFIACIQFYWNLPTLLILILGVAFVIIIAYVHYYLIEKPIMKFSNKF